MSLNKSFDKDYGHDAGVMSSQQTIDEFFHAFHPVEVEENLRELLNVIMNPRITTTDEEKEEIAYFLQRLTDLVKAVHSLKV